MTEQTPVTPEPNTDKESEPEVNLAVSSGTVLKEARLALGISLDELSEQIRVPLNVLEAIEIDKVPKNLPETFIRGYIRSYARKVNVDESLVLADVETVAAINQTTSQSSMQSFSRRTRRKALEKRLVYFSWFMVIAVVIAVVYWWFQDSERSSFGPVVETGQSITSTAVPIQIAEPMPATEDATEVTALETEQQGQTISQQSAQQDAELPAGDPMLLTAEQKALVADNGEPDEAGFLKVEMKFENDCWVEVYDVAGERVAVGTKPAGYLMTLNAQGPLNVALGNPVGVSVWVNGKVFDTSDLPRNRVARFELEAM